MFTFPKLHSGFHARSKSKGLSKCNVLAVALICACFSLPSFAGSKTGTMAESATVANSCVILSTNNLSFGAYIPSNGAPMQTSGQVSLRCTKGAVATVLPVSGGSAMSGGGSSLSYSMFIDSGYTTQWGAPAPVYNNVNFNNSVYFYNGFSSLTQAQCAAKASGAVYAWTDPSQTGGYTNCYATWSATQPSSGGTVISLASGAGLVVSGSTVKSPGNVAFPTIYAPSGTLVSGLTYNVLTSTGNAASLTKTSTSVGTPLNLTYYGQIPAKQDIPPGAYTDVVTIQVAF